jgi:hypothetical protein
VVTLLSMNLWSSESGYNPLPASPFAPSPPAAHRGLCHWPGIHAGTELNGNLAAARISRKAHAKRVRVREEPAYRGTWHRHGNVAPPDVLTIAVYLWISPMQMTGNRQTLNRSSALRCSAITQGYGTINALASGQQPCAWTLAVGLPNRRAALCAVFRVAGFLPLCHSPPHRRWCGAVPTRRYLVRSVVDWPASSDINVP